MNHSDSLTKRVIAKELRQAQYPESLRAFLNIHEQNNLLAADFQNAMRLNEWNREVILFSPFGLMGLMKLGSTKEQKIAIRTHVKKVLHFIRVLTLLNQRRRMKIDIGESKYVVANPEDIAKTLAILHTILRSTVTRLGKRQDELLDLFEQENPLTKHTVAQKLNISESTAYKHLKSLYTNGYLQEERTTDGAFQYHLLNKPVTLGVLQNPSQYYLFFKSSLEKLLDRLSPLSTPEIPNSETSKPLVHIIDLKYATELLPTPPVESGEQPTKQELTPFLQTKATQLGLSKTPSEKQDIGTPFFESCYFCQKPIWTEDWVADEFTAHKPAHKECYEQQKVGVRGA